MAMSGGPAMAMSGGPAMMSGSPAMTMQARPGAAGAGALAVEGMLPALSGAVEWLGTAPLTAEALRGKVVLIDFWTYSCINCLRAIPYVRAWAERYRDQGLVVIGVHTPEFAFERNIAKPPRMAICASAPGGGGQRLCDLARLRQPYGRRNTSPMRRAAIRHHHFGRRRLRTLGARDPRLLARPAAALRGLARVVRAGRAGLRHRQCPLAGDLDRIRTRLELRLAGRPGEVRAKIYEPASADERLGPQRRMTVGAEIRAARCAGMRHRYRFHARDLHLVLGPGAAGRPVRFRVTLDGAPPGASHGVDADAEGRGVVTGQRLYQLLRQDGAIGDRTFEIRFLDPGVQAYAFTFG